MGLIKAIEVIKKENLLAFPHRGIVVDNDDPDKLGRVKVTIADLLEETDSTLLPWVYPHNPTGLGGNGTGWFGVPEEGSELIIEFPFHDIYSGVYTGFYQNVNTHQSVFDDEYPNTYGWVDSTGTYWKVKKTALTMELYHASGIHYILKADGSMDVIVPEDKNEDIGANSITDVGGDKIESVGGDLNINVTGAVNITAGNIITLIGADGAPVAGVITALSVCPFTGQPHVDASENVLASK